MSIEPTKSPKTDHLSEKFPNIDTMAADFHNRSLKVAKLYSLLKATCIKN